jgi:hypothetical protein
MKITLKGVEIDLDKSKKITLNGVDFDLTGAVPFKVREWKALEKQGLKLNDREENAKITTMAMIAQTVLKKANPSIADDFVDDLTLDELIQIASLPTKAEVADLDRPT